MGSGALAHVRFPPIPDICLLFLKSVSEQVDGPDQFFVSGDGEAVCHAGNEVADGA
jgi:hypothetical protein